MKNLYAQPTNTACDLALRQSLITWQIAEPIYYYEDIFGNLEEDYAQACVEPKPEANQAPEIRANEFESVYHWFI